MPYKKAPNGHSEFGGGPGMIDPVRRKDRVFENQDAGQQLWEIYATDPADPSSEPETSQVDRP